MKNLTKLLVLSLVFATGLIVGNKIQQKETVVELDKKIVASQVAEDGECQITFSDGSSETVFLDMPKIEPIEIKVPEVVEKVEIVKVPEIIEKTKVVEVPVEVPVVETLENTQYTEKINSIKSTENSNGDTIINFTDGSYALYNEEKKEYIFQHYELGDWDLELNSARELEMVIKTFLNIE
ncbi:hypothetical protein ACV3Z5_14080 [Clostridium perfringens]